MRSLDASFLIDLLHDDPDAVGKATGLQRGGERMSICAAALAEVLLGAYFQGGTGLRKALEVLGGLDVLPVDADVTAEAGRLGAELLRRGVTATTVDLLIAAASIRARHVLVTRDTVFARIPGLAVETY